jgi:ornithine carbamoyltransferase
MHKDFLSIMDYSSDDLNEIIHLALATKQQRHDGIMPTPLAGKSVALIFHKPSLRTRMSFEKGIHQLGGHSIYVTKEEFDLGKRETIADAAKVLSRYVEGIMIRTFHQHEVVELAKNATVPVINGLTDLLHPCQILSDLMTVQEKLGTIEGITISYFGDGNNVANSWMEAAARFPFSLRIATSQDTLPDQGILERALKDGAKIEITHNPMDAARGADVIYTDVWASMQEKDKAQERASILSKFQVNKNLVSLAKTRAIVMHCLPAERGREITDEVMDGPQSVVFDQAENRLHLQKAILMELIS